MMAYEYKDKERPSWSEIDKRKDRSRHRPNERPRRETPKDKRVMNLYKAKLEEMFSVGKKGAKEENEALRKLNAISDRGEFVAAADAYLAENEFPHDWENLETFLRHRDVGVLTETVQRMESLLADQNDLRKENFARDLRMIEMTTRDKGLRQAVAKILKQL